MQKVVGVRFAGSKMYYFAPNGLTPNVGDGVIVETVKGVEYGTVAMKVTELTDDRISSPLKPIIRLATREDSEKHLAQIKKANDAKPIILEKIRKSNLEMKLVDVEYTFDTGKLIIYFTSDTRVDFRDLVRELASHFHTRIELRQIGARDECRNKGGIAPCGRACCCSDYMKDFSKVSIKMAKTQGLSINPAKISGLCGRLMCCLAYENAHYSETNKKMPKIGASVTDKAGKTGTAVAVNFLKETVRVKFENGETIEFNDYPVSELKFKQQIDKKEKNKKDDIVDNDTELKKLLGD